MDENEKDYYSACAIIYKNGVVLDEVYFLLEENMGSEAGKIYTEDNPTNYQEFSYFLVVAYCLMVVGVAMIVGSIVAVVELL